MSTVFGDFVFRIVAPVQDALKNLKMWDKQAEETTKNTKEYTKEQKKMLQEGQALWRLFGNITKTAFLGIAAAVMKWSPHIRAHLSIIGLYMRMLARDIGKSWAPAFKLASSLLKDFTKTWREWGKGSEKMTEEQKGEKKGILGALGMTEGTKADAKQWIHDIVNDGLGIGAFVAALATVGRIISLVFGGGGKSFGFIKGFFNMFKGIVSFVTTRLLPMLINGFRAFATNPFFLAITGIITGVIMIFQDWAEKGKKFFAGFAIALASVGAIIAFIVGLPVILVTAIGGAIGLIIAAIIKYWDNIKDFFIKGWQLQIELTIKAWNVIKNAFMTSIEFVINLARSLWEKVTGFFESIWDSVKSIFTTMSDWVRGIWQGMLDGITNGINKVRDAAMNIVNTIKESFAEMIKSALNWGSDLVKNIWQGIKNTGAWLKDKLTFWKRDSIESSMSYDRMENDREASKWGRDLIQHFAQGIQRGGQSIVNQRITSSLNINNNTTAENMDPYGIASLTNNMLDASFAKMKSLGSQYT